MAKKKNYWWIVILIIIVIGIFLIVANYGTIQQVAFEGGGGLPPVATDGLPPKILP
jgi:hypothetical protein